MAINKNKSDKYFGIGLFRHTISFCLLAIALCFSGFVYSRDEVSAFKITGYEGYVEARFRDDENANRQGGSTSFENRQEVAGELFLLTHSYVYHPQFLKMDLGFGPVLIQSELNTNLGSRRNYEDDYNLLARLNFLQQKPYPLFLYYVKEHPSVSLTVTDIFRQRNEDYGFDFQIKRPVLPVELKLNASRKSTKGNGFEQRIDDTIDHATFAANLPIKKDGFARFTYDTIEQVSNSGFISDPITDAVTTTDTATINSRVFLGDKKQYSLFNLLSLTEQGGIRNLKELRYTPELRWRHNKKLDSFYKFNYLESEQEFTDTRNIRASASVRYEANKKLNVDGEIHVEDIKITGLDVSNYGTSGNISYTHPLSFGSLNMSAGLGFNNFDRKNDQLVFFESRSPLILVDFIPQFLPNNVNPHDNIVRTSINVYRASTGDDLSVGIDTDCSQIDPGTGQLIDILVKSVGTKTTIQNCKFTSDNNLAVNFDYFYNPGGTVDYNNFSQAYQANLQIQNTFNIYARYFDNDASINSGSPTTPLDEHNNKQVGATADYPLYRSLKVGGEIALENERGTLTSYDRQALDGHVQFNMFKGILRLRRRHVLVDYKDTTVDVDLIRNSLQYRIRPWHRIRLTLDMSDEEDTGGIVDRRTKIYGLTAQWQIRRLILLAEARKFAQLNGDTGTDRNFIHFTVRREF